MGTVIIHLAEDRGHQVPFRYVRLLTLGRFEFALTWPVRRNLNLPTMADRPSDAEMVRPL